MLVKQPSPNYPVDKLINLKKKDVYSNTQFQSNSSEQFQETWD